MLKKILLLGSTGKMGVALREVFGPGYEIVGKNSRDFDANDFSQVENLVKKEKPDILINTVVFLGIDPCEKEPEKALGLNTLYPRLLAELSNQLDFLLIHFSTDAVFNNEKRDSYTEEDAPCPLNIYGLTKYGGDCFVQAIAKRYYIFRVAILFGETNKRSQFVEKMLDRIKQDATPLRIADDIISSPTYSRDIAQGVRKILEAKKDYGVYHLVNEGQASLCDLMQEIARNLQVDIKIEKASYRDFPYIGMKNIYTPIKSAKIENLRPWKEAVREYCLRIKDNYTGR